MRTKGLNRIASRSVLLCALLLLSCTFSLAQTTRVRGRVTDKDTGEGIPFAGVFVPGTLIGVSCDMDGYYTLETREEFTLLRVEILGYKGDEKPIKPGTFQEVNFRLEIIENRLNAAVVKPDNRRMKYILSQIDANKKRNNPYERPQYQCDVYTKMELDLTDAEQRISSKSFRRNFGFVFDYMDTSAISGQAYLPMMISETRSKRFRQKSPAMDREVIEGNRISGLNDDNILSQFTGSMHVQPNFYESFLNVFGINIPSPVGSGGTFYYNYYLIDSLQVDGRKTWKIRFHPKEFNANPVWDGEMNIDSHDFGLRSMHVRLMKGANINWIRDMAVDVENQLLADSTWFFDTEKLYADFSLANRDSTVMAKILDNTFMSFIGQRTVKYSNPVFEQEMDDDTAKSIDFVSITQNAYRRDEAYWDSVRPFELSEREKGIYTMVDSIQTAPAYKRYYTFIKTLVNGYTDVGKISIGPVFQTISHNDYEGWRFKVGARTSMEFSRRVRFGGWLAYGTKDEAFKAGGTFELMLSHIPTRKLSLEVSKDVTQLGAGNLFATDNMFYSMFTRNTTRKSPVVMANLTYQREWNSLFENTFAIEGMKIDSSSGVPFITPEGESKGHASYTAFHVMTRFSKDEIVTRNPFTKYYIHSPYPWVAIDLAYAPKMGDNFYSFFQAKLFSYYRWEIAPIGFSRINLEAGIIEGKVPYPMLKLHEGNGSYFLNKEAFSCMDYYEFASDRWVQLFWEHNFGGFFLGRIPLLRYLNFREVATMKAAVGTISKRNNATKEGNSAPFLFPEGMGSLEKPYVEVGVGITNIFQLLRVDWVWRTTHRYRTIDGERKKADCFMFTVGAEFSF